MYPSGSERFGERTLRQGVPNGGLDQIPCGGDFTGEIDPRRIQPIDYVGESQAEIASGGLDRSKCFGVSLSRSRDDIGYSQPVAFDFENQFGMDFGSVTTQ